MQLSLSSVPADTGASSAFGVLPGTPGEAASATDAPPGFAQVLAGCGPSATADAAAAGIPPNPAVPLPAMPSALAGAGLLNFAPGRLTLSVAAGVVPNTAIGVDDVAAPEVDSPVAPTDDDTAEPLGQHPADLCALSDLQALAAVFSPVPSTPPPQPLSGGDAATEPQVAVDSEAFDTSASNSSAWTTIARAFSGRMSAASTAPAALTPPVVANDGRAFDATLTVATNRVLLTPAVAVNPSSDANPTPAAPLLAAGGAPVDAGVPIPAMAEVADVPIAQSADLPGARNPVTARADGEMKGTEKIAATAADTARPTVRAGSKVDAKSFVASDSKRVTRFDSGIGISTADSPATMPAGATPDRPTSSASAVVPTSAPVSEARTDVQLPAPVALTSTAHRAVEAALATADRFSSHDQRAVTLQFSVGGSDLNVRVELRAGEVHTTFRTDSPELRTALSNEWQTVTNQSVDRPVRLAAPVFTSGQENGTSFSGDGASRQHHQDTSNAGTSYAGATSARAGVGGASVATSNSSSVATPVQAAAGNSVHVRSLA